MTRDDPNPADAAGEANTPADLLPRVYGQLRRQAQQYLRGERKAHTLSATALVHEAYVRLMGAGGGQFGGIAQFYAAAAEAMRRILIDYARSHRADKRGGKRARMSLTIMDDAVDLFDPKTLPQILALDEALIRLKQQDASAAEVVRLRFYAGLNIEETAKVLGISPRTVKRNWQYARAWLYRALE